MEAPFPPSQKTLIKKLLSLFWLPIFRSEKSIYSNFIMQFV